MDFLNTLMDTLKSVINLTRCFLYDGTLAPHGGGVLVLQLGFTQFAQLLRYKKGTYVHEPLLRLWVFFLNKKLGII